jgi:hypothetical protein
MPSGLTSSIASSPVFSKNESFTSKQPTSTFSSKTSAFRPPTAHSPLNLPAPGHPPSLPPVAYLRTSAPGYPKRNEHNNFQVSLCSCATRPRRSRPQMPRSPHSFEPIKPRCQTGAPKQAGVSWRQAYSGYTLHPLGRRRNRRGHGRLLAPSEEEGHRKPPSDPRPRHRACSGLAQARHPPGTRLHGGWPIPRQEAAGQLSPGWRWRGSRPSAPGRRWSGPGP